MRLEDFHPSRIAAHPRHGRRGVAVEKAAAISTRKRPAHRRADAQGQFDLTDMREQLQQMASMGGKSRADGHDAGVAKMKKPRSPMPASTTRSSKAPGRGWIDSMTRQERKSPESFKASRKRGSPRAPASRSRRVNKLLKMPPEHGRHDEGPWSPASVGRWPASRRRWALRRLPSPETDEGAGRGRAGRRRPGACRRCRKIFPPGFARACNLPGLTGLSGKPNLPGLGGFPDWGKKK